MTDKDRDFLATFLVDSKSKQHKYYAIYKHSALLLLLPHDRSLALKTLSLYQPQSFKAKFYIYYIKTLLLFRATFLLTSTKLGEFRDRYSFLNEQSSVGLLLGNPSAEHRRLIVYHEKDGESYVSKLANLNDSTQAIAIESDNLRQVSGVLKGAPGVLHSEDQYYTVKWLKGCSPIAKHAPQLCELLLEWIKISDEEFLKNSEVWKEIERASRGGSDEKFIIDLGEEKALPAAVHGDFAPWNIKVSKDTEIYAIDWESYIPDGFAGWDWAHYLIQSKSLIGKMKADEVLEILQRWSQSSPGRSFLEKCGWGENYLSWVGSYLYYAHYNLKFDRKELIECWKKIKAEAFC